MLYAIAMGQIKMSGMFFLRHTVVSSRLYSLLVLRAAYELENGGERSWKRDILFVLLQ